MRMIDADRLTQVVSGLRPMRSTDTEDLTQPFIQSYKTGFEDAIRTVCGRIDAAPSWTPEDAERIMK